MRRGWVCSVSGGESFGGDPPEVGRSIEEIEPGSSQERVLISAWQVATRETLDCIWEWLRTGTHWLEILWDFHLRCF